MSPSSQPSPPAENPSGGGLRRLRLDGGAAGNAAHAASAAAQAQRGGRRGAETDAPMQCKVRIRPARRKMSDATRKRVAARAARGAGAAQRSSGVCTQAPMSRRAARGRRCASRALEGRAQLRTSADVIICSFSAHGTTKPSLPVHLRQLSSVLARVSSARHAPAAARKGLRWAMPARHASAAAVAASTRGRSRSRNCVCAPPVCHTRAPRAAAGSPTPTPPWRALPSRTRR